MIHLANPLPMQRDRILQGTLVQITAKAQSLALFQHVLVT